MNISGYIFGPFLSAAALVALAACATPGAAPEPRVDTVDVKIPVTAPCQATRPARPAFGDSDAELLGAQDAAERYQRVATARTTREAYEAALNAALDVCGVAP